MAPDYSGFLPKCHICLIIQNKIAKMYKKDSGRKRPAKPTQVCIGYYSEGENKEAPFLDDSRKGRNQSLGHQPKRNENRAVVWFSKTLRIQ
jgi:hypothetical protein